MKPLAFHLPLSSSTMPRATAVATPLTLFFKPLGSLLLFLILVGEAQAQEISATFINVLVPDEKVHDFGTIREEGGPVSHTFLLKNTGNTPVAISSVTAWCGCTTADYPKAPIGPGRTGRVTVTYDPNYRPGKFSKEVVVLCNDGRQYLRLWVKGTVIGMQHPVTDDHPYDYGCGLFMSHRVLPFPALKKGEGKTFTLRVANNSDKRMIVELRRQPNNRILQMPDTLVLQPHERRLVSVSYKAVREYAYRRRIDILPVVDGKTLEPLRLTFLPAKMSK